MTATHRSGLRLRAASLQGLLAIAAMAYCCAPASAQLPHARLYAVSPAGGQAGSEFELKIANGEDLDEVDRLIFNHDGIKATQKTEMVAGKEKPVTNTFQVTISPEVDPGIYEVRAAGIFGLTNPRAFMVGDVEEIAEKENNNNTEEAQEITLDSVINGSSDRTADVDIFKFTGKKGQRVVATCYAQRIDSKMSPALEVSDESGRRLGYGRKEVRADPLVDVTLPADGTYYLRLNDFVFAGGNEYVYRLSVGTRPYIDFIMPPAGQPGSNGKYTVYGRNLPGGQPSDVTLHGTKLEKSEVQIALPADPSTLQGGDNLQPYEASIDGVGYSIVTPAGRSNVKMVHLASAPVVLEQEPNNDPQKAQSIKLPVEFCGQFQERGDTDWLTFEAKAGEVYSIEAYGQRSGSGVDPYFILQQVTKNDKGEETVRQLTAQDDTATNLLPNVFDTKSDDPAYRFKVPADGTYRLSVKDRYFQSRGNPSLTYRVAIRREQPDFRVVAVPAVQLDGNKGTAPSAVVLRKGENVAIDVIAFRQDNFDGPVHISAANLPPGVECKGAVIGAGSNSVPLIFSASEKTAPWSGLVQVVGKANVADPEKDRAVETAEATLKARQTALQKAKPEQKEQYQKNVDEAQVALDAAVKERDASIKEITRPARVGTVIWPSAANVPAESRVARALGLAVLDEQAPYQVTSDVFQVEARQSRQILMPVKLAKRDGFDDKVQLTVTGLPKDARVTVANVAIDKGKDEALVRLFVENNAPARTYTLYLKSQGKFKYSRNPKAAERAKKEQEEVAALLKSQQEAAKQAATALTEATKADQTQKAAATKTETERAAAEKQTAAANTALKQAQDALAGIDKNADDAAKKAAEKKVADAQEAANKAKEDLAAKAKLAAEAAAAAKAAAEALKQADAAKKAADATVKTTDALKKKVDKEASDLAKAAAPKDINITPPSTPLVIAIKEAPVKLTAAVPGGGNIKRGAKLEIKTTIQRLNGFTGPVSLSLPLPPGVEGVTAAAVTIPADEKEGVLVVQASGNATEGQLENMVVRATMEADGKAAVDAPIKMKVSK